jgi:hypothetical protein
MVQHPVMSQLTFLRLNTDWNADPNAPDLKVACEGSTVTLSFHLNPYAYTASEEEIGYLVFNGCSRWRRDKTDDDAWYSGRGRFSTEAPKWGEFYEIIGHDPSVDDFEWEVISTDDGGDHHFLFYFRDQAIECMAEGWALIR